MFHRVSIMARCSLFLLVSTILILNVGVDAVDMCDQAAEALVNVIKDLSGIFLRRRVNSYARTVLGINVFSRESVSAALCPMINASTPDELLVAMDTSGVGLMVTKVIYGLGMMRIDTLSPFLYTPQWCLNDEMTRIQQDVIQVVGIMDNLGLRGLSGGVYTLQGLVQALWTIDMPVFTYRSSVDITGDLQTASNTLLNDVNELKDVLPEMSQVVDGLQQFELKFWVGPDEVMSVDQARELVGILTNPDEPIRSIEDLYEAFKTNHGRNIYNMLHRILMRMRRGNNFRDIIMSTNFPNLFTNRTSE